MFGIPNSKSFVMETVINNKAYLCECNNCSTIMIDKNPQTDAIEHPVPEKVVDMKLIDGNWACPVCNTDDFLIDFNPTTPQN